MLRWLNTARYRLFSSRRRVFISGVVVLVTIGLSALFLLYSDSSKEGQIEVDANESLTKTVTTNDGDNSVLVKPSSESTPDLPFIFGVGTELDHAADHRITKEAPIKLLTSWFNGPKDLDFMKGWRNTIIPEAYASGYALHLIIYSNDREQSLDTPYGAACGRPYPLSNQFLNDIGQLAQIFSGGKLYVSMFTELQTYPCSDNNWVGSENYYRALKDQYTTAIEIFHQNAEGSQVSLSWGGWQAEWDDAAQGGGLSLFKHFADVMNASDFQSFQAMSTISNLDTITKMTKALDPYTGGVMIAHYKPDNGSQGTFNADLRDIFTPTNVAILRRHGLFAFSFMDTVNMDNSETTYQNVKKIIHTYTR